MNDTFKRNNFDIIRLLAALQVASHHTIEHFKLLPISSWIYKVTSFFPGVPIFFFVSGFLISRSYESNPRLLEYAQNRLLRIYPALFLCTFLSLLSVYFTGYFDGKTINLPHFFLWILGQLSFFQFYNPSFMRGFGTGVLNGSLWTISVELQFYILIPIIYILLGLLKADREERKTSYRLIGFIAFFLIFYFIFSYMKYEHADIYAHKLPFKLFSVSFFPWLWMFFVGIFFQRHFEFFHRYLAGKALPLLLLYLLFAFVGTHYFNLRMGNGINPFLYFFLILFIFSFAYTWPDLGDKLLKRNDISYGIYIYHIPVANIFIYYGYIGKGIYVFFSLSITVLLAIFSWFTVEKNSMKLKKHSLNPLFSK